MNAPDSEKLQKSIWKAALTALSIVAVLAVLAGAGYLFVQAAVFFKPLLLPLCVAAVIAYLCDPVVGFLERAKVPRQAAIGLMFLAGAIAVSLVAVLVVPRLVQEAGALVEKAPQLWDRAVVITKEYSGRIGGSLRSHPEWVDSARPHVEKYAGALMGSITGWLLRGAQSLPSLMGTVVGLAMVPVFVFYLLAERHAIEQNWKHYVPLRKEWFREEITSVIEEINRYMIVFFRGQVLVAFCIGALTSVGLASIGLDFALLLGLITGVLSVVPYLGIALSIIPTLCMAYLQSQSWQLPAMALAVFGGTQIIEGFFITPKIMGERVGLHPLTIIIAILFWSQVMGGMLGALLAIPLTATLRVLFFRYIVQPVAAHH